MEKKAVIRIETKKMPCFERGWIAGMIDGDGCLTLKRDSDTFVARLTVTNVDEKIIHYLFGITGIGHVSVRKAHENYRKVFVWEVTGPGAKQILAQIILVGKEAQRKLLLEAQDLIEQHAKGYTPYVERLAKIRMKVHKLNQGGDLDEREDVES